MAQITAGLRSVLSNAFMYNAVQQALGAERARKILVRDYFPEKHGLRMLDIGCGTAEILKHLPPDIVYEGFDASEAYIAQARSRFGNRGRFHAELVQEATFSEAGRFDLVLAFGLLHHLDDGQAHALFALAGNALSEHGVLITMDPCYAQGQSHIARWIISKDRGQNVRYPEQYRSLAGNHFSYVREHLRQDMLYIPYTHLVLTCRNSPHPQN